MNPLLLLLLSLSHPVTTVGEDVGRGDAGMGR